MADNIKNMLDDIINRTNKSYPASASNVTDGNLGAIHKINAPTTFDKGAFKEKLSMYVLKDLIQAMMVDDTSDLDNTIDTAILRHMKDDCGCGCYNYLKGAKDRLKSDLLGDIIQEIDEAADTASEKVSVTKDPETANDVDVNDILENVDDYNEFKKLLTEKTTNQVVEQMKNEIVNSNQGAVWNDKEADEKIGTGTPKVNTPTPGTESSIMKIYSTIIYESYVDGKPTIDEETGMEMAFIEYCLDQLDHCFKVTPKHPIMARYNR